jgi:pimeloyl-ACP methyl ester carboxylesterase
MLRFADEVFRPPPAPRAPDQVRTVLKHALWRTVNPFDHPERFHMPIAPIEPPIVGNVRRFASAESFAIAYHPRLSSRCTRFIPAAPVPGRIAIYIDGHQGDTVRFGAHTIDKLLDRGWQVIAVDMPLVGANGADISKDLRMHNSFSFWQTGDFCPVSLFVQPLKALVDQIYREHRAGSDLTVMLIGKSGGGWTSFMYGALDPRIHYAVSIAGGTPLSQRLRGGPQKLGDYEQLDPRVYEAVPYEDIMPAAGSRGAFYVFNEHDPCCSALSPDDPFVRYLKAAAVALEKPIGVYVDRKTTSHTFTKAAFEALERFLVTAESRAQKEAATRD